jgi:ketosteroid isomerase-like protein
MSATPSVSAFEVFAKELFAPYLAISAIPTPAEVGDDAAIRDVLNEYCYCYDAGDVDRVVRLFTDDAVISNVAGIHRGIVDIRKNYVDFVAKRRFGFHYVTNVTIRFSEEKDEAVATSYLLTLNVLNTGQLAIVAGSYIDRLRKSNGYWRIAERRITADIRSTTNPD